MSQAQLFGIMTTDPFIAPYASAFTNMIRGIKEASKEYIVENGTVPITNMKDYDEIRNYFRTDALETLGVSEALYHQIIILYKPNTVNSYSMGFYSSSLFLSFPLADPLCLPVLPPSLPPSLSPSLPLSLLL